MAQWHVRHQTRLYHGESQLALGKLQPGVSAKIYGIANFFELGVRGRIGCGGLAPTKRTSEITEELLQCFDLLRTIVATRPCKQPEVVPHAGPRFLADVPPRRYQERAQGAS